MSRDLSKYILGVNEGHLSTCCLLVDDKIGTCVSEERLTRVKGIGGFPTNSVKFALDAEGIAAQELDLVVLGFRQLQPLFPPSDNETEELGTSTLLGIHRLVRGPWHSIESRIPSLKRLVPISDPLYGVGYSHFQRVRMEKISSYLGIPKDRIITADHHRCHALTAWYGSPFRGSDALVFTSDGLGDGKSGTVSLVRGGAMETLATISADDSLALLYLEITRYLGMKPLEDEYKVMGLAGYTAAAASERSLGLLRSIFAFDGTKGVFRAKYRPQLYHRVLPALLRGQRFDNIAGGIQRLFEEEMLEWVGYWIEKTGVGTVCLAGGSFMNVKTNMRILEMPGVERLFVFPSGGDESIAIGAAYYGYERLLGADGLCDVEPIRELYLGPSFSDDQIDGALSEHKGHLEVSSHGDDISGVVAELLARGDIVARFAGRMEWGARALGNRSILADASKSNVAFLLNRMIKQRDFWMPFAPTVLWKRKEDYLEWSGKTDAPYMSMAFRCKRPAERDLLAAIHQFDRTARPQVLERDWNPDYYAILEGFEAATGRGGILNTSFNLHGEPIVCAPKDALRTFESSGLEYLAIGGFLVHRKG